MKPTNPIVIDLVNTLDLLMSATSVDDEKKDNYMLRYYICYFQKLYL